MPQQGQEINLNAKGLSMRSKCIDNGERWNTFSIPESNDKRGFHSSLSKDIEDISRMLPSRIRDFDEYECHSSPPSVKQSLDKQKALYSSWDDRSKQRVLPSVSERETDERRVFPFVTTPSGNLKIIPNQVVFESKKVSVLVADPKRTKVNVKSESDKLQNCVELKEQCQIKSLCRKMGEDFEESLPIGDIGSLPHEKIEKVEYVARKKKDLNLEMLGFNSSDPIDWKKVTLPYKSNVVEHILYRLLNYVNPDCIIQIGHDIFNCHLIVLQCYSEYFSSLKDTRRVELPESNVTPSAFIAVYDWMIYTGPDSYKFLNRENVLEILMCSQYLEIKELLNQCWAMIKSDDLFNGYTAFCMYRKAKTFGHKVAEIMVSRIGRFFLTLVSSKDFVDLRSEEICDILQSDHIAVHCEIEVFMSAVRWLMHDYAKRKLHTVDIMNCVRFGLIEPWQLVDVRRNPENPEFLEISSYPEVQRWIEDGLAYVIIKYWYGDESQRYCHWINLLGLREPDPRIWIGEEVKYITYQEFLEDLANYSEPGALLDAPVRNHTDPTPVIDRMSKGSVVTPPLLTELLSRRNNM